MRVVARRALTVFNLSAVPIFSLYYYEIETSEFNISGVWVRVNYPKPYLVILLSIMGRSFIPPGTPEGGLGGGGARSYILKLTIGTNEVTIGAFNWLYSVIRSAKSNSRNRNRQTETLHICRP